MTGGIENEARCSMRRLNFVGLGLVALFFGGVGCWSSMTLITGAVVAPGSVIVESKVKQIQHPTGGVVGEILVKEGDLVERGRVLMRLDATIPRSTLNALQSQLDGMLARAARLRAERDRTPSIKFPDELLRRAYDSQVADAIETENTLFDLRRRGNASLREQLHQRIAQVNEEIGGLSAEIAATEVESELLAGELVGVSSLYDKSLVSVSRLMQMQRDKARLGGAHGRLIAERAGASAKVSETELQILQLEQNFRTELMTELRETQGKIAELNERITAARDQLMRIDIRAPQGGYINHLVVHTVGGVIPPGETLMEIVPEADGLLVEARVAPPDIDQIVPGAATTIRILAGNQRTMPEILGSLTYISADLTRDERNNQAYYVIRASLPPEQVKRLGNLKLVPGMPAELFVHTLERTPLEYFLKPLEEQVLRAFRER